MAVAAKTCGHVNLSSLIVSSLSFFVFREPLAAPNDLPPAHLFYQWCSRMRYACIAGIPALISSSSITSRRPRQGTVGGNHRQHRPTKGFSRHTRRVSSTASRGSHFDRGKKFKALRKKADQS